MKVFQGDVQWPDLIASESDGTVRAQTVSAGASLFNQTGAWCGTALDSAMSNDSLRGIRFVQGQFAKEAERSSSILCPRSGGTDDVRQPDSIE